MYPVDRKRHVGLIGTSDDDVSRIPCGAGGNCPRCKAQALNKSDKHVPRRMRPVNRRYILYIPAGIHRNYPIFYGHVQSELPGDQVGGQSDDAYGLSAARAFCSDVEIPGFKPPGEPNALSAWFRKFMGSGGGNRFSLFSDYFTVG